MHLNTRIIVPALQLLAFFLVGSVDGGSSSTNAYGSNLFVDSSTSYYDGYQQAWRYLGWYVKCGSPSDRYDEDDHSGEHDEPDDRNLGSGDQNRWQGSNYCQRYLIWAAVSIASRCTNSF